MRVQHDNPWNTRPSHTDLVSVGDHSLWASITGPIRGSASPLLIFMTGAGASSAVYLKLKEALSAHVRVLFYDRAGYDRSTLPPEATLPDRSIHAADTARDLTRLLKETSLEPPYVLMGHSYGGIPARAFLEMHKDNVGTVAGMILCDTATELMLQFFTRVPDANLESVAKNVDWEELTHLKGESGMSDAQWEYALCAQQRAQKGLAMEDTHGSGHELALCEQFKHQTLGGKPLLVMKFNMAGDFQRRYNEGVRLGGGTEEEREKARIFILLCRLYHDQIARAQCRLSSHAVYKAFEQYGHDVPIRNARFIAGEVREYLGRIQDA